MKMSLKNKRVSFRIKENDIEIIEKAKEYCKEKGIVFGKFIIDALDYYMNKDRDPILKEIEFLRDKLLDIESFLKSSRITFSIEEKKITIEKEVKNKENLPSFLKDNPWVKILSKKGRGREEYE